jgi:photosystem II stability/assembly factor-like uncharacterized protein
MKLPSPAPSRGRSWVAILTAMLLSAPPWARANLRAQNVESIQSALSHLTFRHIGPANVGGRVSAIVGIPGDPSTFWVGGADGGVWNTTNGGVTFEGQWQDAEAYSVGAIAVAPSDRNVVWLGSGEGDPRNSVSYGLGVWRSTDAGKSWTHMGLENTERIKRIVVDPRDPDVALVCALGKEWGPNPERGVFRTTDGGWNWDQVLFIDTDTGCADLDLDLSNPRNVYAGMWTFRRRPWRFDDGGKETAVYVSRDGGDSWRKIETLPDEPMARPGLSVAQSSPNVVYLVTEFPTAGTVFRSDDYGESWRMVNDDPNVNFRPFYYSDIFADPSNADVVYSLAGGLSKSTDGGRTWSRIAAGVHGDHQALWIDPADGDRLLSGSDGGFQVSYDGGADFHIFRNVDFSQFYHVFLDDQDPYWVCGGLQDNGNWCGPSRTRGPAILTDEWFTVSGGDGFYAVPVPGQPWLVYSDAQGGYFRITDTRSGTTRSIEPHPWMVGSQGQNMGQARYRFNWDAPIHISPNDPSVVYWGGNVLFRSRDYGYSWDIISPDLTTDDPQKQLDSGGEIYTDNTAAEFHTTIYTIAESPVEAGVIWVGTDDGNVQLTRDDGESWTNVRDRVPGLPAEAWIGNIEASPTEAGGAFLVVDNHRMNDFTPHVWETTDYGQSWRDLSAGLPQDDYAKVLRQHPENSDLLFLGMDRGLFASFDRGRSWVDLRLNLPRVSVRGIKIEPRYNDLVIGTHGIGAWILDDIQPLVELTTAMEAPVHLFDIHEATDWESWNRDSNLGRSTFEGENPQEGVYIDFWLSREMAGEGGVGVTVRITEPGGGLVRELSSIRGEAGVNRAVWNFTYEGAEPIPGEERGGGRFGSSGPPAPPGTYVATLVIGDQELSKEFRFRGDPAVTISQDEYRARTDAALRGREVESRLNGMIGALVTMRSQIEALMEALNGKDLADAARIRDQGSVAVQAIDELENQLRRPPPRMGYRQWPRLAEQLSFVTRGIAQAQARPTEGQLQVLGEIEEALEARAADLRLLIDGPVAALNRLLEGQPAVWSGWSG